MAREYPVHPTQINQWKKHRREGAPSLFGRAGRAPEGTDPAVVTALYEKIGRLNMELDWLKKKLIGAVDERRALVAPPHPDLTIERQCDLLGVARSSYYYQPAPAKLEDLRLMRLLDEQYFRTPFYGSRRMTVWLQQQGYEVNRKRVQRLMRLMGLVGIAPGPATSHPHPGHPVYPYLLQELVIERPNQVWCSAITYVPMPIGLMYLVVIMDWFSRYVLTWELANSLEVGFCLGALEQALARRQPEIFNTDQGAQFTSPAFTTRLEQAQGRISLDGRGRTFDNIFVERLWRTVK